MHYSITSILSILDSSSSSINTDDIIQHIAIDSREFLSKDTLFFCIVGERNNGHQYIADCYQKGVRNFVIAAPINFKKYPEANFILVKDTLFALQKFASYHRSQFKLPVIGITGSNGKTIIKEWLFQLLATDYSVVKSPKSYNSQVGVPLSVLNINEQHQLAIFEAGISTTNEMQFLQAIIQPSIGIFSNIGPAHNAGFKSLAEKVNEKLKLFSKCEKIIYCLEHQLIHQALSKHTNTYAWKVLSNKQNTITLAIYHQNIAIKEITLQLKYTDDAAIENTAHCVVLLFLLGYTTTVIQERILLLKHLAMRLELKYGINRTVIIDDAYSADFLSLQVALSFLNQQQLNKKRTLIISDFEESGLKAEEFIAQLQPIIKQYKFDKLIAIGNSFRNNIEKIVGLVKEWYVYETTQQFLSQLHQHHFEDEVILIKGSRKFEFEKISQYLLGQIHETVLEINLNALIHNLNIYKSHLNSNVGIIAMVKAFSYGSGSVEVANLLDKQQVSYLAVAYTDEGVHLRNAGITTPIIVMNPDAKDFNRMLQHQLEPEIYSKTILHQLLHFSTTIASSSITIHLKIETGMHRLGIPESDINEVISLLKGQQQIKVATIFSHLAASENELFDNFSQQQITLFKKIASNINNELCYPIKWHILNSSGIIRFKEAQFDYVRLGIGLYGVDSSNQIQSQLQTIGKLKTRVAQLKYLQAHETVGYSRKGVVHRNSKIAVLAIGYADGFDRRFGNGVGEVFINGSKAKIIGNICMDMCMADVTHIDSIQEGDEVEIYGNTISIIEQATKIGTIPYELLTAISSRVKRLYFLD